MSVLTPSAMTAALPLPPRARPAIVANATTYGQHAALVCTSECSCSWTKKSLLSIFIWVLPFYH